MKTAKKHYFSVPHHPQACQNGFYVSFFLCFLFCSKNQHKDAAPTELKIHTAFYYKDIAPTELSSHLVMGWL